MRAGYLKCCVMSLIKAVEIIQLGVFVQTGNSVRWASANELLHVNVVHGSIRSLILDLLGSR